MPRPHSRRAQPVMTLMTRKAIRIRPRMVPSKCASRGGMRRRRVRRRRGPVTARHGINRLDLSWRYHSAGELRRTLTHRWAHCCRLANALLTGAADRRSEAGDAARRCRSATERGYGVLDRSNPTRRVPRSRRVLAVGLLPLAGAADRRRARGATAQVTQKGRAFHPAEIDDQARRHRAVHQRRRRPAAPRLSRIRTSSASIPATRSRAAKADIVFSAPGTSRCCAAFTRR